MNIIKKITILYQYVYYRLYLYQLKQLYGSKKLALASTNFALTMNAGSILFCIDILIEDYTSINFLLNTYSFLIIFIIMVIIQSIVLRKNIDYYIQKFKNEQRNFSWKFKGIVTLLFVYFPIVLLIFLM